MHRIAFAGPVACRTNDASGNDITNPTATTYNCIAQNGEAGDYKVSLNVPR